MRRLRLNALFASLAWCGVVVVACATSAAACANGAGGDTFDETGDGGGGKTGEGGTGLPGTDGGGKTPPGTTDGGGPVNPPTGSTVLINEIMTASASNADVEFVELYNPTASTVSLDGWTLRYKSPSNSTAQIRATLGAGDSIPAGGYLVLGTAGFSPKDVTMQPGLGLGGGQVGLLDDAQAIVDRVGWGATTSGDYTAGNPALMAPEGQSIARTGNDGKNNLDFAVAPTPTPGAAN